LSLGHLLWHWHLFFSCAAAASLRVHTHQANGQKAEEGIIPLPKAVPADYCGSESEWGLVALYCYKRKKAFPLLVLPSLGLG